MGIISNQSQVPFLPMSCKRRTITASMGIIEAKPYTAVIQKKTNTQPVPKYRPETAMSYISPLEKFSNA